MRGICNSDFTAFCVDFFPAVAERFSNSMDRLAKASLLLEMSEAESLLAALQQYAPECIAQHELSRLPQPGTSTNPYRGLAAFQVHESHLFFGRSEVTERLLAWYKRLWQDAKSTRLLAILGPSGAGKSSIARAGLLAGLTKTPVPDPLRFVIVKPGDRPTERLARALVPLLSPSETDELSASRVLAVERLLANPEARGDGLRRLVAELPCIDESPVVLLVDQFEELYSLCHDANQRDLFIDSLLAAASSSSRHLFVVLTLRSDFIAEVQWRHPRLHKLLRNQSLSVPELTCDELRMIIAQPAKRAGRPLDEVTIALLLEQSYGYSGALPLLEVALTRIWEGMLHGASPCSTIGGIGGMGQALASEAKRVFFALPNEKQCTARRAFVRLVDISEGTRHTCRRRRVAELCGQGETVSDVLSVLRKFAEEQVRLVTLSGGPTSPIAEITHESLIQHWREFRTWIEASRPYREIQDRALIAAQLWNESSRSSSRLWQPPDLEHLRSYHQFQQSDFSPLLIDFLNASEARQKRFQWITSGIIASFFLLMLSVVGLYSWNRTIQKQQEKSRQLDAYTENGSRFLFDYGQQNEGLLLIYKSLREGSQRPMLRDLIKSAMQGIDSIKLVLLGHRSSVYSATYSPDGLLIATASEDCSVQIWDPETGLSLRVLRGHASRVNSVSFSPDGRRIVTSSADRTVKIWDVATGRFILTLTGTNTLVHEANWSPDGRRIVVASEDSTAKVFDAEIGGPLLALNGHEAEIWSASYSPDGRYIVTGSHDRTARVWHADTGMLRTTLYGHDSVVWRARFSSNSQHIVTASADHTARLWSGATGEQLAKFRDTGESLTDASFSPNGRLIVTASVDKLARIWEVASGQQLQVFAGHGGAVHSAAFGPDGQSIVTASDDGSARVWNTKSARLLLEQNPTGNTARLVHSWDQYQRIAPISGSMSNPGPDHPTSNVMGDSAVLQPWSPYNRRCDVAKTPDHAARVLDHQTGHLVSELLGCLDEIRSASFSPNARRIATVTSSDTASVWDSQTGLRLAALQIRTSGVVTASFDPNGQRIVTTSADNAIRIWEAESGRILAEFKAEGSSLASVTFTLDGRHVVSKSQDGTVRIWDAKPESRSIEELAKLIRCYVPLQFESPDSSVIVPRTPTPEECQSSRPNSIADQPPGKQ